MLIVHIRYREWLNDTEIWKNGEERKKARHGAIKKDEPRIKKCLITAVIVSLPLKIRVAVCRLFLFLISHSFLKAEGLQKEE
jgi:hypothetical protein